MITKETYKELLEICAKAARMQHYIQALSSNYNSDVEDAIDDDDTIEGFRDAVVNICESYDLMEAIESLCATAATLDTEYGSPLDVQLAFTDSASAWALDEENGEQFADLMTEYITTGKGTNELRALEKEMSADDIYWLRRQF